MSESKKSGTTWRGFDKQTALELIDWATRAREILEYLDNAYELCPVCKGGMKHTDNCGFGRLLREAALEDRCTS